jgi:uroporphyrin-III C-methyltransferase
MIAPTIGKVYLVGAGPGDPELITLKGKRCLEAADVILFDELANHELLQFADTTSELIYVGKKPGKHCADQREIEALLIERARRGKTVVRLKGGDPFVFGRGGEEAQALSAAGIPFEIVPGISSALAVPAYAGIPVTHRARASSFAVVTGHKVAGAEHCVNWRDLVRGVDTLIILMGVENIDAIMNALVAEGCDPQRPVALIQSGTRVDQRTLIGTVLTIAELAVQCRFKPPAVIVVGLVVEMADELKWFRSVEEWQTTSHFAELHIE